MAAQKINTMKAQQPSHQFCCTLYGRLEAEHDASKQDRNEWEVEQEEAAVMQNQFQKLAAAGTG